MAENETAPASDHRGGDTNAGRSKTRRDDSAERPFVHRWRSAVFNSTLPPTVRLTLLALAEFADADGTNCFPAVTSVAEIAGINEKTARRTMTSVEHAGWFVREERRGQGQGWRQYAYRLLLPKGADTTPARKRSKRADTVPSPSMQGADTTPARQDETCGLSRPNVRTLTPERAGVRPDELAFDLALEAGEALSSKDGSAVVWKRGVELLKSAGETEKNARSIIGKLRSNLRNDDARLLELIETAEREISDPVPWLMQHAKPKRHAGGTLSQPLYQSDPVADEALLDAALARVGAST